MDENKKSGILEFVSERILPPVVGAGKLALVGGTIYECVKYGTKAASRELAKESAAETAAGVADSIVSFIIPR